MHIGLHKGKFALLLALLAAPLSGYAEQLIPAGSLIQCTVAEPKISSKTESVGDPVLCQVSHVELYGRSTLPYGSYLEGRFEDYKDPGHLYGKGWMELKFDRLIMQPDTVIPISAKVVYVPKYNVDKDGKIHGKGHPVRDTIEWAIPVLWPIDLINLPRRGPRPTLKPETRLTLKVMDDFGVPSKEEQRAPALAYREPAPAPNYQQPQYQQPVYQQQPQYQPPPPQQIVVYQNPPQVVQVPVVVGYAPRYVMPPPPPYGYVAYRPGFYRGGY